MAALAFLSPSSSSPRGACAVSFGRDSKTADAATIALGTSTFTVSALRARPPFRMRFRCLSSGPRPSRRRASAPSPRPSCSDSGFWLARAEAKARGKGEGYEAAAATDPAAPPHDVAQDLMVRERATTASSFDPAEISHGHQSASAPSIALAILPLAIVIAFNLYMSLFKLPGLDASYLAEEAWARHRCPQSAACGR
jgi:hypothetical protein